MQRGSHAVYTPQQFPSSRKNCSEGESRSPQEWRRGCLKHGTRMCPREVPFPTAHSIAPMPLQDTYTGTARGAMRRGGRFADRAILSASASIERSIGVDLGEAPVHVFDKPSASTGDDAAVFSGLQYIGSYNWIDAHEPTIVVPGASYARTIYFY